MKCEEFEDRLNAVLDERHRPQWDAELRLHCETCGECRRLANCYSSMLDGFYSLAAATSAPSDLALRVLAEVRPVLRPTRRWSAGAAGLAIAAALAIAVLPLVSDRSASSTADSSQPAPTAKADRAVPGQPVVRPLPAQALGRMPIVPELISIAGSKNPSAEMAKGTGQSLATVMLLVPGIGGTEGIIDVDSNSTHDEPTWAVHVSEGLRPVTDTVTETFNLLLRSLPDLASRS